MEEKDKQLDLALTQIERQFGKGAVMRLGDHAHRLQVEAIPTGSIALDIALGVGGFPRGRVMELFGPEGSGKCLVAGTYVWTDRGLETIEEVFERCGQKASCTSRVTDIHDVGLRIVNEQAELEQVAALTHNYRRRVLRLRLRSGRTITVTRNHPLRVMEESGFVVWRTAEKIETGDTVVSALFGAMEAAEGDGLSEQEAVLIGYLVAEGTLSPTTSVRFTNWDPEVGDEFSRLMDQLFDTKGSRYGAGDYAFYGKALRAEIAERYDLDYVTAEGKKVPHCIRTGGAKMQRAFLSALFEGDGWIDGSSTIGYCSASEQLAREVQLLLYGFGIPATLSSKRVEGYDHDYWTVTVNPSAAHRFIDEIGFRSARRQAQVQAKFRRSRHDPRFENIPHLQGLIRILQADAGGDRSFDRITRDLFREELGIECSRRRLSLLVKWAEAREGRLAPTSQAIVGYLRSLAESRYSFETVESIEDGGEEPTFDLVVPETHSFLANGILSHNTTVALHVIAEAQKLGGVAAFIDAEHALDPAYAKNLGVDIDSLLVSQPDTGEQALEIADMLIRSGAIDVLTIDSVAALVPRAELEGEMGDTHVGLQARLMSQALRKLTASVSKSRTCVIFINQIREKIGVMFGCLAYGTRVTLADGSQEKIGKIVNQRLAVEVLSYDPDADAVVPKRIANWFDNGRTDGFLQVTVAKPGKNGRAQFGCTSNHKIRTPSGWKEAQELRVGDRVMQAVPHYLSGFQWEVILGGLMGDGALSPTRSGHGARFRWGHGAKQKEYNDWKASLFANVGLSRWTNAEGAVFCDLTSLAELGELRKAVYVGGKKIFGHDYLKALTPLSLAVWYMDDAAFSIRSKGLQARTEGGSGRAEICVEAMDPTTHARLTAYLADNWGIRAKLIDRSGKAVLQFPTQETAKLHALIAPYVHPSMDYKLLPRFRGRFAVEPSFVPMRYELMPLPITRIHSKPPSRSTHRFDIEVEGSHNYLADGVVVHNSPETTPGGRALKFYSSVRLDVRRIEGIKDGAEFIGNRVRAKVVKNKCLAAGSLVFDPTTGLTHRIEEIVDNGVGGAVYAADKTGKLHVRPIASRFDQGEQDVIGVSFRGRTTLWATSDHKILTDKGWREAGQLEKGDYVARPRKVGGFGREEPVSPDHARLIGYLIGDGYVGGKTPTAFINTHADLRDDAARMAKDLGCRADVKKDGIYMTFSHRRGEKNGVLALARWAGIWGHLAPEKKIPAAIFSPDVSEGVVANLLFGIWETDGWISREQSGGIRCGFVTTSEQLAHQIRWLLLRWGIGSSAGIHEPGSRRSLINGRRVQGKLPCWQVRVSGIDNVTRFAEAIPMWGPRGRVLSRALDRPELRKHRGSRLVYLPPSATAPVLAYLEEIGLTAKAAAPMVGYRGDLRAGLRVVLGPSRLRRDRVEKLAEVLDSEFLRGILEEDVYYERVWEVLPPRRARTFDIEVDGLHTFVADDVVVHNCAPPFRTAEFDLMYSKGISKEGSLLDVAVERGIVLKSGAWYTYNEEQIGQGRENAKAFLAENPAVLEEIERLIKAQLSLGGQAPDDEVPPPLEEPPDPLEKIATDIKVGAKKK